MKIAIRTKALAVVLGFLFATLVLSVLPVSAQETEMDMHEDHDMTTMSMGDSGSIEQMQTLVALLQQLIGLLTQQIEMGGMEVHMDDHADSGELAISVEVHQGRTHIHVDEPGEDAVTFFLDGVDADDEDAVIAGVVKNTDLTEDQVSDAISFETDLSGIHIMADGSVMLGDGDILEGATVTEDGMIMLPDGDLVEPVMDMREGGDMEDMDHMDH